MNHSYSTNLNLFRTDLGLLIFRICIGGLMLTHGLPKLLRFFGPEEISFADPFGLGAAFTFSFAVFAEFFCSLFIIFGFLTRIASIPLILTMATAALIIHMPDGFGKQELPLLYLSGFILLLLTGPGKYSIDYKIYKK
ncbi:DoxX family protein [Gramella sp. BOM4]|nr:DoxX family protein [Christiangramia bathymodioli]